jgi:hypothetical protein
MSRKAGSTSSVFIPLSVISEKLTAAGITAPKVAVSKGWVAAMEEAHDIDFEIAEGGEATEKSAGATTEAARPRMTID